MVCLPVAFEDSSHRQPPGALFIVELQEIEWLAALAATRCISSTSSIPASSIHPKLRA
jgi:hypothetical protein